MSAINAVIYVFSGTGNTLLAARLIEENMKKYNIQTDIYVVRLNDAGDFENVPDPNDYDVCGFGYPVHAANTPEFFLKFVKSLPEASMKKLGTKAFIFSTAQSPGRLNSSASFSLCRAIRSIGLIPCVDMHMVMPAYFSDKGSKSQAKYMRIHTEKMAEIMAFKVGNYDFDEIKFNPFITLFSFICRVQWLAAKPVGKKYSADPEKCTGCRICEQICPCANVTVTDGKPVFSDRCSMCFGCVTACPDDAIYAGPMDKFTVNGIWNYNELLDDPDILITDTELRRRGDVETIKRHKSYYVKTSKLYTQIFGTEKKEEIFESILPEVQSAKKAQDRRIKIENKRFRQVATKNAAMKMNELKDIASKNQESKDNIIEQILADDNSSDET